MENKNNYIPTLEKKIVIHKNHKSVIFQSLGRYVILACFDLGIKKCVYFAVYRLLVIGFCFTQNVINKTEKYGVWNKPLDCIKSYSGNSVWKFPKFMKTVINNTFYSNCRVGLFHGSRP